MTRLLFIAAFICLTAFDLASAQNTNISSEPVAEVLDEAQIELRAKEVGRQLRCVICKNVSIEDSDATMAQDMRVIVRQKIREGQSNADVLDYMQTKYGDFVLLKTPVNQYTFIAWALPIVFLLLAIAWFIKKSRIYGRPDDQA